MLSALFTGLVPSIVDGMLGKLTEAFEAYFKKQISMEELRARMVQAMLQSITEVEKAHADALAKTYDSFMQALTKSVLMQRTWVFLVVSQTFVLLWHQVGIPAVVAAGWVSSYPSSGNSMEYAALLVAGLCGLGPIMLRRGVGSPQLDQWRALIGK